MIIVEDERGILTNFHLSDIASLGIDQDGSAAFATFSIETTASIAASNLASRDFSQDFLDSFEELTNDQADLFRSSMAQWADASGVTVFEVPAGQGDVKIGYFDLTLGPSSLGSAAYLSGDTIFVTSAPIIATDGVTQTDVTENVTPSLYLHEIGHFFGLKHTFEGDFILSEDTDNHAFSVMSYTTTTQDFSSGDVLGSLDLIAIDQKYGGSETDGSQVSIWDWNPETFTLTQTGFATDTVIRGVGGNNVITALDANDVVLINSNNGTNMVDLGGGADRLITEGFGSGTITVMAGPGDDILQIDIMTAFTVDGGSGFDSLNFRANVFAGSTFSLADALQGGNSIVDVENISVSGSPFDDSLFNDTELGVGISGAGGDDIVRGGSGNDFLEGGDNGVVGDIIVFTGAFADYEFATYLDEGFVIEDRRDLGDGRDVVVGFETFRFADGDRTEVEIAAAVPRPPPQWRLLASDGFNGEIAGNGEIFGSAGLQDISIPDLAGSITLDPSFNQGGDIVRLPGNAQSWQVVQSGSSAIFSDGDTDVLIPGGTAGLAVVFDDGARAFRIDTAENTLKIGDQGFAATPVQITAASDGTPLPGGADPQAAGQLILFENAEVQFGGMVDVFGTGEPESITVFEGNVTFDPSTNRGGDTIIFAQPATGFMASLSGSAVLLESGDTRAVIPVGTAQTTLSFTDGDRPLFIDTDVNGLFIGDQQISMTASSLSDLI